MEQVLGHVTWYQNLRRAVDVIGEQYGVQARWVETAMYRPHGRLERLRGVPPVVKASGRALIDTLHGLRDWPHDVLFFNTQKAAALCQWQLLTRPTVLMTDVTPAQYDRMAGLYEHALDDNPLVQRLKHDANVLNLRLAAALVAWSKWTRDSFVADYGIPAEKIHVIPPGVDIEYWESHGPRPDSERVQLLFVGGNFERKGGRLLLDVFTRLSLQDRAELHVVTRDDVEGPPGVTVHRGLQNNSPELLGLYRRADVFVLPTLADCFSIASIEAMAAGLPVICTAMGGIPDIVEHGRTGYLLPPGDGVALGEALRRLIDDPQLRRSFSHAGRCRAVEHFDARRSAARILALAQALAGARRRSRKE
jgi:glycosyltransferase involved in cell wall biosynthesis